MKVDNIITRAAHYESFTMSGAGYILNDGLALGQNHEVREALARRQQEAGQPQEGQAAPGAQPQAVRQIVGGGCFF